MIRKSSSFPKAVVCCLAVLAFVLSSTLTLPAQTNPGGDFFKETSTYPLTMDKIHRLAAAAKDLSEYQKSHPELSLHPKSKSDSDPKDLTEMANLIDSKYPEATAIFKKNGYSTREYLLASMTFALASMAVQFKKSGMTMPADKSEGPIVQANKDLIEKNWDEMQKLSAVMKSLNSNR